uniref:F-box protein At4g22390-like n=1 Tax=Fragaria vesca subsp. vesca TaxID=101020 RepID=UPI0005C93A12|nr:PREDICTED: F-box protein At4g22390-like [Fragaria vesca subsp. vesca]
MIWNPTVRKFMILPRPVDIGRIKWRPRQTHHAFGHDSRNNDYKVLRIVSGVIDGEPFRVEVLVYSLARGSWRTLAVDVPACYYFEPAAAAGVSSFLNGASHWIQTLKNDVYGKQREEYVIVWFNMETELFGEIQMPEAFRKHKPCSIYFISKYEEYLALIESSIIQEGRYGLQVWVMKEYGVVESWTRLYMNSALPSFPRPPFCFESSCELVFQVDYLQKSLRIVNLLGNEEVKSFRIDQHSPAYLFSVVLYILTQLRFKNQERSWPAAAGL